MFSVMTKQKFERNRSHRPDLSGPTDLGQRKAGVILRMSRLDQGTILGDEQRIKVHKSTKNAAMTQKRETKATNPERVKTAAAAVAAVAGIGIMTGLAAYGIDKDGKIQENKIEQHFEQYPELRPGDQQPISGQQEGIGPHQLDQDNQS